MRNNITYHIVLLILFTLGLSAQGQEIAPPDYGEIKLAVFESKSENHYPKLLKRYCDNDSTLTLQQMRYLYYGYTLQEDFIPYQQTDHGLYETRQKLTRKNIDTQTCHVAIEQAQKVLDNNPFDIPAISTIAIGYLQLGDTIHYTLWNNRLQGIFDAILSTGDGETPETAFHVINIEHEYEIINRLGQTIVSDSTCSDEIEYLKIQQIAPIETESQDQSGNKASDQVDGYYFNFGACLKTYMKKYHP